MNGVGEQGQEASARNMLRMMLDERLEIIYESGLEPKPKHM